MRLFLLGLSLWLSGCALNAPLSIDQPRITSLPSYWELSQVPFIQQQNYQCGPASLAMVMNYHGYQTTPNDLVPWVFTPNAEGSFPAEMDAVTRKQGLISYPIRRLDDLLLEVQAGHPILVLQNLGVSWYPKWHFAVVVGFDLQSKELILRSGEQAQKRTGFRVFNNTWQRSNRWARAILPPNQLPATVTPLTFLKAAADLQQTGPSSAALNAFKTAANSWPENTTALFGLANQYYALQQYAEAQSVFESLIQLQPQHSEAWNNYAYSLLAQQCKQDAVTAIQCANQLNPQRAAFADSLTDIQQSPIYANNQCQMRVVCPK